MLSAMRTKKILEEMKMSTEKTMICGNCKTLAVLGGSKCGKCGQPFTGKEVGVPEAKQLRVEGKLPSGIEHLRNLSFARKPVSPGELKDAVISILIGIIGGPLIILFGFWVIGNFRGPGVLFFGYGGVLAGVIMLLVLTIMGLNKLLRDPRQKSIKNILHWIWKGSYFNNADFNASRYISADDAAASAIRAVPAEISDAAGKETLKTYITGIREAVDKVLTEEAAKVDTSGIFTSGRSITWTAGDSLEIGPPEISAETEKEDGLKKATGTFKIVKNLTVSRNDKGDTYSLAAAAVELSIHNFYVNSGKFWFPVDLMPEIK
jgi:hypothetical protein